MSDPLQDDEGPPESVVTTATLPKSDTNARSGTRQMPPYNVVILNDEEHSFEYVIELLTKLFAHSLATAETLTWRIHHTGRAVVLTTHKEKAEFKRDQVLSYGADPYMGPKSKGPLNCYIEPAASE